MAEIVLSGAPIDLDINKDGDLIVLTESKVFVISLSRSKDSDMLSNITLPVNDLHPLYSKVDLPFMIAKRVWWLPSTVNFDSILLLTTSLQWLIYHRVPGSLQWTKSSQFCPGLDKYFKYLEGLKCNKFVDMILIEPIVSEAESVQVNEYQRTSAAEPTLFKGQHVIDDDTMPQQYHLGEQVIKRRRRRKKKQKIRIKKEVITPALYISGDGPRQDQVEEEGKPVIKQLTKTSSSGEKRLITYIMDGKQREDQFEEDDCEEKVQCVCGATEENSSEDEEWVECELCHTWQHVDCVAYFPEVQDYFHCDNCLKTETKKVAQSKTKSYRKGKTRGRPPKERADKSNENSSPTLELNGSLNKQSTEPIISDKVVIRKPNNDKTIEGEGSSINDKSKPVEEIESSDNDCPGRVTGSDSSYGITHHGNHINCPCGASESESGEEWVQCDECDKWQHQLCVNYADEDKTHYQCPSCKQILTFFANKKFAPITADSLAAKTVAPSAPKEKFRIPKLPKNRDDGFKIVGSSCYSPSTVVSQSQPIYIPKSLDEASLIGVLKSAIDQTESGSPPSQTPVDSSDARSGSGDTNQNMSSNNSSAGDTSDNKLTNGINLLTEANSDELKNSRQINSFAVVLCTNCLIVLRGSPESPYQISSLYTFDDRELCMMSVLSNAENTEHHVAMVDYNSSDVLVWKLNYSDDGTKTYSESVKSLPSLVLTGESVLSLGKENIDRIMWMNQSHILIYKRQGIYCYDVVTSQSCWATEVKFDFVVDWFLQSDKKLIVFDNIGSNIVINADNGNILHQNIGDQKDDLVVNSRISPSNMLKFEIRIPANLYLQYSVPSKLYVSRNELFSPSQTQAHELLDREQKFLKMNVQPSEQKETLDDNKISEDLSCPICNCTDLTPSEPPFGVMCFNKHTLFMDPDSMVILDPFTAKECPNCSAFNLETSVKCGSCKQRFNC